MVVQEVYIQVNEEKDLYFHSTNGNNIVEIEIEEKAEVIQKEHFKGKVNVTDV